jgi:hypothetical protein
MAENWAYHPKKRVFSPGVIIEFVSDSRHNVETIEGKFAGFWLIHRNSQPFSLADAS